MANKPSLHKNALHTKKNCATLHFEKCFTRYHQILCYGVIVVIRRHHCVQCAVCSVQRAMGSMCIRGHYCGHLIHRNVCCLHAPLSQQTLEEYKFWDDFFWVCWIIFHYSRSCGHCSILQMFAWSKHQRKAELKAFSNSIRNWKGCKSHGRGKQDSMILYEDRNQFFKWKTCLLLLGKCFIKITWKEQVFYQLRHCGYPLSTSPHWRHCRKENTNTPIANSCFPNFSPLYLTLFVPNCRLIIIIVIIIINKIVSGQYWWWRHATSLSLSLSSSSSSSSSSLWSSSLPNIDGDGMLLQAEDRKYWSRPTPTTSTLQYSSLQCTTQCSALQTPTTWTLHCSSEQCSAV